MCFFSGGGGGGSNMYNRVVVHGVQITCLAASSTDSISKNDFFESFCDSLDEVDID